MICKIRTRTMAIMVAVVGSLPVKAHSQVDTACSDKNLQTSISLQKEKKYVEALFSATQAIVCGGKSAILWTNRASIKNNLKDYKGAQADIDTAFMYGANNSDVYRVKGRTEYEIGRLNDAISSFAKALDLNPKDESSYYYIIGCYGLLNKYRDGLKYIELAYQNFEPAPELLVRKGMYSFMISDYQTAMEACSEYLKNPGKDAAMAYLYRGMTYVKQKNFDQGISDLLLSIESGKKYTESYVFLGVAYAGKEQYEQARFYFNQALQMDASYADTYWEFATMEQNFSDRASDALSLLDKYEKLMGEKKPDPKIYLYRAACYSALGDTLRTLENFDIAFKVDTVETFVLHFVRLGILLGNKNFIDTEISDLDYFIKYGQQLEDEIPYFECLKAYIYFLADDKNGMYSSLLNSLKTIPQNDKPKVLYDLAIYELFYAKGKRKVIKINKYLNESISISPTLDAYKLKAFCALIYEKDGLEKGLEVLNQAKMVFKDYEPTGQIDEMERSLKALNSAFPISGGKDIQLTFSLYSLATSDLMLVLQKGMNVSKMTTPPAAIRFIKKLKQR